MQTEFELAENLPDVDQMSHQEMSAEIAKRKMTPDVFPKWDPAAPAARRQGDMERETRLYRRFGDPERPENKQRAEAERADIQRRSDEGHRKMEDQRIARELEKIQDKLKEGASALGVEPSAIMEGAKGTFSFLQKSKIVGEDFTDFLKDLDAGALGNDPKTISLLYEIGTLNQKYKEWREAKAAKEGGQK